MADRQKLADAYEHLQAAENLILDAIDEKDGTGYASVGQLLNRVAAQITIRRQTVYRFVRGDQQRVAMTTPTSG